MTAPAEPEPTPDEGMKVYKAAIPNADFPVYGHFNTGYPFLGVDSNVFADIKADLEHYRPDVDCEFNS